MIKSIGTADRGLPSAIVVLEDVGRTVFSFVGFGITCLAELRTRLHHADT